MGKTEEIYCTRYRRPEWSTSYVAISTKTIELLVSELSYAEIVLLLFIAKNERSHSRDAKVSYRYLEKGLNCSSSTISKGLRKLLDLSLIEKVQDGYRTRYHEDEKSWRALRPTSKNEVKDPLRKTTKSTSKIEADALRKTRQREELSLRERKKGGQEGDSLALAGPAQPSLRLLRPEYEDAKVAELQEKFNAQLQLAMELKNPVIKMTYWVKGKDLPESYLPPPPTLIVGQEDLCKRYAFLTVTNQLMEAQQKRLRRVMFMPSNLRDVELLGDTVANFMRTWNWDEGFGLFINWVVVNKDNWSFNFLGRYLADWGEIDLLDERRESAAKR